MIFSVEVHDVSLKVCVNAFDTVWPAKKQGVAKLFLLNKQVVSRVLTMIDFLYVPEHPRSLLSLSNFVHKCARALFDDFCEFRCCDEVSFLFV